MAAYTRVEYIKSTGSQYIDTGYKANNRTRIVMELEIDNALESTYGVYGARDSAAALNAFAGFVRAKTQGGFNVNYGQNANTFSTSVTGVGRVLIDHNCNKLTINGKEHSLVDTGEFQGNCNMFLMAVNQGGSPYTQNAMTFYPCQIYDNGTLVRDYIPCKIASGEYGLWDKVEGKFYGNAGTGAFTGGAVLFDTTSFLSGLTMGLTGKGVPGFTASDTFTKGYLLGAELRSKRPEREPVAYLYNGVRLPALDGCNYPPSYMPELEFPYAHIAYTSYGNSGEYQLYFFTHPLVFKKTGVSDTGYTKENSIWFVPLGVDRVYVHAFDYADGAWEPQRFTEFANTAENGAAWAEIGAEYQVVWSSHDILNEDGSVYFAASDPVPVYE